MRYQNRFRHLGIRFFGAAESFDDRRKVGAWIDEEIVRAVVGECAQESFSGNRWPLSRRCRGHFFAPHRPVPADAIVICFVGPVLLDRGLADNGRAAHLSLPGYSAAIRSAGWPSISARHFASLSPSGSTNAAVRALATASAARAVGIWPASAGRITRISIAW